MTVAAGAVTGHCPEPKQPWQPADQELLNQRILLYGETTKLAD
jgi:hypothetical protein